MISITKDPKAQSGSQAQCMCNQTKQPDLNFVHWLNKVEVQLDCCWIVSIFVETHKHVTQK